MWLRVDIKRFFECIQLTFWHVKHVPVIKPKNSEPRCCLYIYVCVYVCVSVLLVSSGPTKLPSVCTCDDAIHSVSVFLHCTYACRKENSPSISVGSLKMIKNIAIVLGFLFQHPPDYRWGPASPCFLLLFFSFVFLSSPFAPSMCYTYLNPVVKCYNICQESCTLFSLPSSISFSSSLLFLSYLHSVTLLPQCYLVHCTHRISLMKSSTMKASDYTLVSLHWHTPIVELFISDILWVQWTR